MVYLKKAWKKIKRFWNFVWNDNSPLSWLLALVISYLIIKFIFFPVLEFSLGTSFPLVAVVSGSMEHRLSPVTDINGNIVVEENGNHLYSICGKTIKESNRLGFFSRKINLERFWQSCGQWYNDFNITKEDFSGFRFSRGFNRGDIMIIYNPSPEKIQVGDIVVFDSEFLSYPIIHRVVSKDENNEGFFFSTKGDHNPAQNPDEKTIHESRLHGKAVARVPLVGYVKIGLFELKNWLFAR
ncbi:MAG TPA: signal peptidase I [Candidatus Woesearchaeota archaeon]|nr:signal peptidase I [Candidatus Woesearchaeota archaeon]